ncbi:MAG: tetratricopeptide repeat protein [Anaerolineales bacterium]|nr:tetratricopeptide repeat protein [Anaerolineales bacterium]
MKIPFSPFPIESAGCFFTGRFLPLKWFFCLILVVSVVFFELVACSQPPEPTNIAIPTSTEIVIRKSSPTPITLPATWTPISTSQPKPSATYPLEKTPTPSELAAAGRWIEKQIPDVTLTPTRADTVPQAARDAFAGALSAHENGDQDRAMEQIEIALSLAPEHADYIAFYGQLLIETLHPIQGENQLDRALEIDPFHTGARNSLAELYASYGRWSEAEGEYSLYLSLLPDDPNVWFALGQVREQQNRIADAISAYSETLILDSAHQEGLYRRGELWLLSGNIQAALKDMSALIDIEPSYLLYQERAEIYLQLEEPLAAETDYLESISLFSAEGLTYTLVLEMGNTFLNARYPIQASSAFSLAIGLDPDPKAYLGLAESYLMMGDFPAAIQIYSQTLPLASTAYIGRVYSGLGRAHLGMGNFDLAVDDLTQAIAHADDDDTKGALLSWRSEAYAGLGQIEDAIADLTLAMQYDQSPVLYYRRGLLLLDQGDEKRANRDFMAFLDAADPDAVDQALIDDARIKVKSIKNG